MLQLMTAVALIAVAFGTLVDAFRFKQVQSSCRKRASQLATLEKLEIANESFYRATADRVAQSLEHLSAQMAAERTEGKRSPTVQRDPARLRRSSLRSRFYTIELRDRRIYLEAADQAKAAAQRYSDVRRQFEDAADQIWFPFAQDPVTMEMREAAKSLGLE